MFFWCDLFRKRHSDISFDFSSPNSTFSPCRHFLANLLTYFWPIWKRSFNLFYLHFFHISIAHLLACSSTIHLNPNVFHFLFTVFHFILLWTLPFYVIVPSIYHLIFAYKHSLWLLLQTDTIFFRVYASICSYNMHHLHLAFQ